MSFTTPYGTVNLTAGEPNADGRHYNVSLASNNAFDNLRSEENHEITVTSEDGTSLTFNIIFRVSYRVELSPRTFTYSDSETNLQAQTGTATTLLGQGAISYGIDNNGGTVTILVGNYGTLSIDENTGEYSYEPNAGAILVLTADASETFVISATDTTSDRDTEILTITITAIDDPATLLSTSLNEVINTVADEGIIDLGTITINDVDSDDNLTSTTFSTPYGTITLTATGTPETDGQYSLSLDSNQAFDDLTTNVTTNITLPTADGTNLTLTLSFFAKFTVNLSPASFTYSDTQAPDNFIAQTWNNNRWSGGRGN